MLRLRVRRRPRNRRIWWGLGEWKRVKITTKPWCKFFLKRVIYIQSRNSIDTGLFCAPYLFVGVFWGTFSMKMEYHREQCVMEGKLLGKNVVCKSFFTPLLFVWIPLMKFEFLYRRWGSPVKDRGAARPGVQRASKCHLDPKWHRNERIASVKEGAYSRIWAQLEWAWKTARWIKLGRFGSFGADAYGLACWAARKLWEAAGQDVPVQAVGAAAPRQASFREARPAAQIHRSARPARRVHSTGRNWAFKVSSRAPKKAHCLGADLA